MKSQSLKNYLQILKFKKGQSDEHIPDPNGFVKWSQAVVSSQAAALWCGRWKNTHMRDIWLWIHDRWLYGGTWNQKLFPEHHKNIPFNSSKFLRISKRRREAVYRKTVPSHIPKIHTDLETGKACYTELHLFKHSCMQKIPRLSWHSFSRRD